MAYTSNLKSEETDALFDAVLKLKTQEECYRFFTDLCTINEVHAMSQRFAVARLLSRGSTYTEIEEKTKASTATISRINKCLVYGADGYRLAIDRLDGPDQKTGTRGSGE